MTTTGILRRRPMVGAVVAVAVVTLYVVTALLTAHVSGRPTLPLFEGVGPPPDYQWMAPPAVFAAGNVRPKVGVVEFPLGPDGNQAGGASDSSGQFVVTLAGGAIPARAGETIARIRVEPLDPSSLPKLPGGLLADGNAYRLVAQYVKSGATLDRFSADVSAVVGLPLPPTKLLVTSDNRQWREIPTAPAAQSTTLGARFRDAGVFLVGTTHVVSSPSTDDGTSIWVIIAAVAIGVLLVGGGVWFLLRLRTLR